MGKKRKKRVRKREVPVKKKPGMPFLAGLTGKLGSFTGNYFVEKEKHGVTKTDILCDALIELGIILLLVLAITAYDAISVRQSLIILASLIGLSIVFIRKRIRILEAAHGQLCLMFIILFIYSVVIGRSLEIGISENKSVLVPYAAMILFMVASAGCVKMIHKKELNSLKYGVLSPFAIAVAIIVVLGIGLHVFLSTVYPMEFFNLLHIYRQVLQYLVLFVVISNFVATRQKARRVSIYILSVSLILMVLKIGTGL